MGTQRALKKQAAQHQEHATITPALLREWGACYDDDQIAEHFGDRESVTLLEVLDSEIAAQDRVWVASYALSERDARLFACWCAEQVLGDDCDPRSRAAVDVARRYALGEATSEELSAARDAAWDAAWDAAGDAARDAARDAAGAAAWAAWAAARDAARAAARDAARAAARDAQVARIRRHVTGEEPLR